MLGVYYIEVDRLERVAEENLSSLLELCQITVFVPLFDHHSPLGS